MVTWIRKQKWNDLSGYTWGDLTGYTWDTLPGDCYLTLADDESILDESVVWFSSSNCSTGGYPLIVEWGEFVPSIHFDVHKLVFDSSLLSDSISKLSNWKLSVSDPLILEDVIFNLVSWKLGLFDTLLDEDILSKLSSWKLSIDEALNLSDLIMTFLAWKLGIFDPLSLVDSIFNLSDWKLLIDDPLLLIDSISKSIGKPIDDPLSLVDSIFNLSDWKLLIDDPLSLVDSILKSVGKPVTDSLVLDDSVLKSIGKIITDPLSLVDLLQKALLRKLVISDSFALSDIIAELYNPDWRITDLFVYGGAEGCFYPEQSTALRFNIRKLVGNLFIDPDLIKIDVYDSRNINVVKYNPVCLIKESIGIYKYIFNIPKNVTEGNWHVTVSITRKSWTTVLNINFEVRKR
jgi:hypothetical protein